MTSNHKSLRCAQALRHINWSKFLMAEDGRQSRHLAQQRCALVKNLAIAADPDGSNILLSSYTMAHDLGCSRQTIYNLLDDLKRLGFLEEGGPVCVYKKQITKRSLNLAKILAEAGVQSSQPAPVHSSDAGVHSSTEPLVSNLRADVSILREAPCVQSSFVTQPSGLPETKPKPTVLPTIAPEVASGEAEGREEGSLVRSQRTTAENAVEHCPPTPPDEPLDEEEEEDDGEPLMTPEEEAREWAEYQKFESEQAWKTLSALFPPELLGAVPTPEQREKLIKQFEEVGGNTNSGKRIWPAMLKEWVAKRELPIEDRKVGKWKAWLEECGPFMARGIESRHGDLKKMFAKVAASKKAGAGPWPAAGAE